MRVIQLFPSVAPTPREIYILAGESDMSGRGLLNEIPAFANSNRVRVFANDWRWVSGYEPVDDPAGQIDVVSLDSTAAASCGMAFGTSLAALRPGVEICLVPCAKGGSKMAHWSRNISRSSLYGSMIARAKEAARTGAIKGVLWWQGKNDEDDYDAANSWAANCLQLIADIRSDLEIPELPVVIAVIDDQVGVVGAPYVDIVQDQQRSISGPGIARIETAGLPMKAGDPVHLSTAGLIEVGARFAGALVGML